MGELLWHAPPCWLSLSARLLFCLHDMARVVTSGIPKLPCPETSIRQSSSRIASTLQECWASFTPAWQGLQTMCRSPHGAASLPAPSPGGSCAALCRPAPLLALQLSCTAHARSDHTLCCSSKKPHRMHAPGRQGLPKEGLYKWILHGRACLVEETGLAGLEAGAPAAAAAAASLALSSLLLCRGAPPRLPKLRRGFAAFTICIHVTQAQLLLRM